MWKWPFEEQNWAISVKNGYFTNKTAILFEKNKFRIIKNDFWTQKLKVRVKLQFAFSKTSILIRKWDDC